MCRSVETIIHADTFNQDSNLNPEELATSNPNSEADEDCEYYIVDS